MIASDLRSGVERLGDMIAEASTIVPFTGAGISTECGIPDFRSPGGLWTRNRPIPFDEFLASSEMRAESWRRRFALEREFGGARPGRGHLALACDLFLAVGSSLVVWPAAGFPLQAKRNGAGLVIINRESTEFDDIAD